MKKYLIKILFLCSATLSTAIAADSVGPYTTCWTRAIQFEKLPPQDYQQIAMKRVGNRYFAVHTVSESGLRGSLRSLFFGKKYTPVFEVEKIGNRYVNSDYDFDVSFFKDPYGFEMANSVFNSNDVILHCDHESQERFVEEIENESDDGYVKAKKELLSYDP